MTGIARFGYFLLFLTLSIELSQEVLIVYFSAEGHTAATAEAVMKGVRFRDATSWECKCPMVMSNQQKIMPAKHGSKCIASWKVGGDLS